MPTPVVGVVVPAPGVPTKQDTVEALWQVSVALKSPYPATLVRCILNIARELQFQPCTCFTHPGEKQTCVWCRLRMALEALDRRGL